jgi:ABC-type transport system involved in cytochrome c biogenesis permease component
MNALLHQFVVSMRLHFRNRMGLLYGYLFPVIFLVAFWVLYRWEEVPLARHMGELLTITVLGGACFGLPTTLVSERERGVWRRYRLAPVSTGSLVASTVVARYVILVTAGLLQLALALAVGMPLPRHLLALWIAFTFVCFAFLGLGLVIATLADNVPAVQALGQCIFLPMLILGGVAVPLASLPEWAQQLSAFFPGRYAVEALQACVTGDGLGPARFSLLALLIIGAAGCFAGAKLFRWDAQQRFAARGGKGWVAVALAAWVVVGIAADARGHVVAHPAATEEEGEYAAVAAPPPPTHPPAPHADDTVAAAPTVDTEPATAPDAPMPPTPADTVRPAPVPTAPEPAAPAPAAVPPGPWQGVTMADIDRLDFRGLPPDDGLVAPVAPADARPHPTIARELACVREALPGWAPARVSDPVQRVRNHLYVAAVPDKFQMERLEAWLPLLVLEQLRQQFREDQLVRILYWVATHPREGSTAAATQLRGVCIDTGGRPVDVELLRERTTFYAVKLLGRLTGRL